MRREQLYHAIRAACTIINRSEVTILGSQSILASFSEDELPERVALFRKMERSFHSCFRTCNFSCRKYTK